MAKRGVKSSVMTKLPPEVRAEVDAAIVQVLEHPGEPNSEARAKSYADVYNRHRLSEWGISIYALKRYAQAVECRHSLSARKVIAQAVADQRDVTPAMRKIIAGKILDRLLDDECDAETLTDLGRIIDRFSRTDLAASKLRQDELERLFSKLASNDAVRAFIRACELVFGDEWNQRREKVILTMEEQLKKGA